MIRRLLETDVMERLLRMLWQSVIAFALSFPMLCISALAATPPPAPTRATAFVAVEGSRFTVGGKPFRVAGYNNHYLTYGTREEVVHVLDDAVAMKANVLRTFVSPIIGSLDGSMPTVWNWKSEADSSNLGVHGVYMASWDPATKRMAINEGPDGLQRLDFLLDEAGKRGLKLVIAFMDFWGYTGGAQQVGAWHGGTDKYHDFAASPEARADYKELVTAVLTRVNTLNGRTYHDDPAVFSWELMNEPDIFPYSLQRDWMKEMAAYVKLLDKNHLLSSGQSSIKTRLAELDIPGIDYGTWHGYATYEHMSASQFQGLIREFCALGHAYGKPVVLEEFGLPSSDPDRPESYRAWLDAIRADPRCGGWLVWRLVSRQAHGELPRDDVDQFDIANDDGPVSRVLIRAATELNPEPAEPMRRAEATEVPRHD